MGKESVKIAVCKFNVITVYFITVMYSLNWRRFYYYNFNNIINNYFLPQTFQSQEGYTNLNEQCLAKLL